MFISVFMVLSFHPRALIGRNICKFVFEVIHICCIYFEKTELNLNTVLYFNWSTSCVTSSEISATTRGHCALPVVTRINVTTSYAETVCIVEFNVHVSLYLFIM
jgi:hypothetical protein